MSRVLYVVACGLTLAACSGSGPSWDFFSSPKPPPEPAALRLESDPPGAEARSSLGPTCRTPCALPIEGVGGDFGVTMALKGYLPQTVPIRVLGPDQPDAGGARFTPNPVFVKLEPAGPPPKKKKARKKVAAAKLKPAEEPEAAPPPAAASPWPPPK